MKCLESPAAYTTAGLLSEAMSSHDESRAPRCSPKRHKMSSSPVALGALTTPPDPSRDARGLYSALVERWKDGEQRLVL